MKRLHFVTLSRSDYASTKPIIQAAIEDADLEVEVTVGGSHLLSRFGNTVKVVQDDGIKIDYLARFMEETDDTDDTMAAAYSRAVFSFFDIFSESRPDCVFIVGDRWEMQAVATVASLMRIPIAHHSGGDITEGSADNQTRYLLTNLAQLHFTALPEHAKRLMAVGEESWRIRTVGEPALSQIERQSSSKEEFYSLVNLPVGSDFVLATFHPTTYDPMSFENQIKLFLAALDLVRGNVVLTAPNPDPGSGRFYRGLVDYCRKSNGRVRLYEHLGADNYYAAMSYARYMIGNSSSGLWEAPSFRLPVINIGSRQNGRIRSENVVDADLEVSSIQNAIKLVSSQAFRDNMKYVKNPYVRSRGIAEMLEVLKAQRDMNKLLSKKFVDPLSFQRPEYEI